MAEKTKQQKEIKELRKITEQTARTVDELKHSVLGLAGIFSSKCYVCGSKCCKYLVVKLDDPEDVEDVEELRWFISHKHVLLCIDEDQWELVFITECEHLDPFGRCRIYEKRPDVCRDHSAEECEFTEPGEWGDRIFRSLEELDDYLKDNYKWWWKEKKHLFRKKS